MSLDFVRTAIGTFARGSDAVRRAAAGVLGRSSLLVDPRDPNTIQQDFEQDVLERLVKMDARAMGVPIVGVRAAMDGSCSGRFEGADHSGMHRKFGIRFSLPYLEQAKYLADPEAVAACIYQIACDTTDAQLRANGL